MDVKLEFFLEKHYARYKSQKGEIKKWINALFVIIR